MKILLALTWLSLLIANYVTMDAVHQKYFGTFTALLLTRFLARDVIDTSQIFALEADFRKRKKKL